jgi:hypothetical protein
VADLREAARRIADAVRGSTDGDGGDEPATGRYRATVTFWQSETNFRADLHGVDLELDAGDVTLGQSVRRYNAAHGIAAGDALILLELADADFVAVDVESTNEGT